MNKNRRIRKIETKAGVAALAVMLSAGYVVGGALPFAGPAVVLAQHETMAETGSKTVVDGTTVWKYLDNNTDPAEGLESRQGWTTKDFNDSAWKQSPGKFGAKGGALVSFDGFTPTVLLQQYIDGTSTDIPAFFFRTSFNIENLEDIASITGTLYHDDGIVVYLNGHEIHRAGMQVKNGADPAATNMYYAGENGGEPREADINVTAEQVKEYAVQGENTLAVELHNDRESSSDVYFELSNLTLNYAGGAENPDIPVTPPTEPVKPVTQKSFFLSVGSDESSKNLTWYADAEAAGEVQYAPKAAMVNGEFPAEYQTVQATAAAANDAGFYSNQVTLANLQENTEYVYRVRNGETVSDIHTFKTDSFDGTFKFAFVGDPQIGAGSTASDIEGWNQTVGTIKDTLKDEFILSAGDQVNTASNETQYAGYLNEAFASIPSATSIGNHDSGSKAYNEHFNMPNESDKGATPAGTDYWYVYGNTLFMDINTNNKSAEEHKAFMEEAIKANPDVKWKTVVFHHSVYSTASHVNDKEIVNWRNILPPIFEELGIDVVLMGHDHVYTRTYMMDGKQQKADENQKPEDTEVTNPNGTLYLTANSASGSKYYDIKAPNAAYSAKMDQSKRRTVTDVQVTDTSYKMTTYFADDMTVLDTFTIHKEDNTQTQVDKSALEGTIAKADALMSSEKEYTAESWNAFKDVYDMAKTVDGKEDTTQEEVNAANDSLVSAMDNLVKADDNNGGNNNGGNDNNGGNNNGGNKNGGNSNGGSSNNGNNQNNAKPDNSKPAGVKTGDSANILGFSLLVAAAGSIAAFFGRKRKIFK